MRCPPHIAETILEIIRLGILRIRSYGWAGASERCAEEADHLHNLPDLLTDFSLDRLKYYWDIERPAFLHRCGESATAFEPLWQQLVTYFGDESAQAVQETPSAS